METSRPASTLRSLLHELTAGIHALMKHADDLDRCRCDPVIEHMHGSADPVMPRAGPRVPEMKAPGAPQEVATITRRRSVRRGGSDADCPGEQGRVAAHAVAAPTLGACCQYIREIRLRRGGKANASHCVSPRAFGARGALHVRLEVLLVELQEVAPLERIHTCDKLRAQHLQA